MKILVTGGAGFIGSTLVPQLLKEGHQVTVLDNLTWGIGGLLVNIGKTGFDFVKGDVRDDRLIKGLIEQSDAVVHLAALVGNNLCNLYREKATDINVNASKKISQYLSNKQLLIYASSGSVYGQVTEQCCTEKTPVNPQSHYASTKLEAEEAFLERGNVVALRFATAFGVSHRMRLDLLVNQFVYEAVKHRTLVVVGRNRFRSVIHVYDIARSILFALDNYGLMQGEVFNVSMSQATTKEQIAQEIKKRVSYDLVFSGDNSGFDPKDYHLSNDKIYALGYRSIVTLNKGVEELIDIIATMKVDKTCFNG